jgi:hypothetical protein
MVFSVKEKAMADEFDAHRGEAAPPTGEPDYVPPTFETSDELREYHLDCGAYWQDLGWSELQRRPDADKWAPAPPVPTRQEIRTALITLENARFHSGWVDLHDPAHVAKVAKSWGIDEAELIDIQRLAGWGSAALREAYIMTYLED